MPGHSLLPSNVTELALLENMDMALARSEVDAEVAVGEKGASQGWWWVALVRVRNAVSLRRIAPECKKRSSSLAGRYRYVSPFLP